MTANPCRCLKIKMRNFYEFILALLIFSLGLKKQYFITIMNSIISLFRYSKNIVCRDVGGSRYFYQRRWSRLRLS